MIGWIEWMYFSVLMSTELSQCFDMRMYMKIKKKHFKEIVFLTKLHILHFGPKHDEELVKKS